MSEKRSMILYGPSRSGKTTHMEKIAAHYGYREIIEAWSPGDPTPDRPVLLVTNSELDPMERAIIKGRNFIFKSIGAAKKELGIT